MVEALRRAVALAAAGATFAAADVQDLTELSLEELVNVEVTSVSKAREPRSEAAAAIAVVTNEDIRRSGVTSFPEALRIAPGMQVGRFEGGGWAVGARGVGDFSSSKLLILVDGRSIYTPLFSGVFWDAQHLFLEDVDRIEVIRGPGGSLWGANAVNGVVNVVTKSARDTHGFYLESGGGTEERAFGGFRYGGTVGPSFHYRLYGRYFDTDALDNPIGPDDDDWNAGRVGFRADWDASAEDSATFQGELYDGSAGELSPALIVEGQPEPPRPLEVDFAGGHLLARWLRRLGEGSDLTIQTYYDRTERDDPAFTDDLDTFDADAQLGVPAGSHELLGGVAYRVMMNETRPVPARLRPTRSTDQLVTGFLQDRFPLAGDWLRATIGTKLEYNEFSGFEVQPTARFVADVARGATVWSAVSRAVRVPTRIERDISAESVNPDDGIVLALTGNKGLEAEELLAFEAGVRVEPAPTVFVDVASFFNRYDGLVSFEFAGEPFVDGAGRTIIEIADDNSLGAETWGGEIATTWLPCQWSRITASYSYLDVTVSPDPGAADISAVQPFFESASPRHQADLRVFNDLPRGFSLDAVVRYVDSIGGPGLGQIVDSYVNLDLRLAWRAPYGFELAVVGQNLVEDTHEEFFFGGEVERGVYGKVSWRN